ncbi:probable indole-3-pyruvate monooxygenase YUCCA10 [Tanacetum coccineum]
MEKGFFLNRRGVKENDTNGNSSSKSTSNVGKKAAKMALSSRCNEERTNVEQFTNEVGAKMGKNSNYGVDIDRDSNMASLNSRATPVEPVSYSVRVVHERLSNNVCGFFLGKLVVYPIVENYVKNTWSKYGLVKSMMITKGMFFFKFSFKDGMDAMVENGSLLICNMPLILKKWTPVANILKEDVCNIFHDITIIAFTEDGLSAIATKLGTPLMLDSYTSTLCTDSWSRSSYAKAMVELRANVELKDTLVISIPIFVGEGYTISTIRVEYELTPPKCSSCKVFGHVLDECPKKIVSNVLKNLKSPRQAKGASSSGIKKQAGLTRQEASTSNRLMRLIRLKTTMSSVRIGGSLNTTPLAAKIIDLEIKMLDGKLVLEGQLEDSDDEIEDLDDDTARYMFFTNRVGGGANDACQLEDEDSDCYDGYEDQVFDLPKA